MTIEPLQSSDVPLQEAQRVAELRSLGILDTEPEERFDRVTRIAQRMFDVPIALISLVDKDRQWFKSRIGLDATETARELSFCTYAIEDDAVMHVEDATVDPRFRDNPLVTGDPGIRFYAGCPIQSSRGNNLGTLCIVDYEPRKLGANEIRCLKDLASIVQEEVRGLQLATTDNLTQLHNRRGLMRAGKQALGFARRMEQPVSLAFVDLDGLKRINDQAGHSAGDCAIVETAGLLRETLRGSDVLARLGGDEFCVLFTDASARVAREAIDRLRVAARRNNETGDRDWKLRFSVGIAEWDPRSTETLEELVDRADDGMYEQKRAKRRYTDRVVA